MNNKPISREITDHGLFCCWRYEERNGKQTKVPYNPRTGERAKSNDPQSFADYLTASCASHRYDGMGLGIFNGICAIDLDHCIDSDGNYSPTAAEIIAMMHSYTELSPSGTGVHILFRAEDFRYDTNRHYIMNRQAGIEVYVAGATNKYVTITGQPCTAYRFGNRSDELQQVLERFMVRTQTVEGRATPDERQPMLALAERSQRSPLGRVMTDTGNAINAVNPPLTTDQLLEKAFSSRRGEAIKRLWSGDTTGYPSHSEADQALCSHLAFWTGRDAGMVDAMFRQSGLMRDKWYRKQASSTYGQITIQTDIRNCTEVYTPRGQRQAQPALAPVTQPEEPSFLPVPTERSPMPRNDGKNYTVARNRDLCGNDIRNAQGHNERQNETYSNEDIVPEHTSFNVHFKQPTADYSEMFDQMEQAGTISTRGLKADATHFCEMVLDVNSAFFFNHGGYEFAKQFYADAYKAAVEIIGGEKYILSAVMHADERNRAMSDALGQDVYHYHMHVVYVPVVEKQILWSKRCKDPALRGTVKETIMQVSRSKKWASQPSLDTNGQPLLSKNGKPILRPSYSVLQDRFYDHMRAAGYDDIERGQRGSTEEHLTVTQFKVQQEQQRLAEIQDAQAAATAEIAQLDADKAQAEKDIRKAEAKLEHLAPQVEKLEELVRRYPDDPEKVLPEAGAFESARSYREKKAMPLVKKLLKWVHSLFRQNNALSDKCDMLERSKAHEVGIWKRRFERAEEIPQQLRPKAEQYDHISRVLDQEQLTQLLSQRPPTHEPTTHRQKGAVR